MNLTTTSPSPAAEWRASASSILQTVGFASLMAAFFFLPLNGLERAGGLPIGDVFLFLAVLAAIAVCLVDRCLPPVPVWLVVGVGLLLFAFLISRIFVTAGPEDLAFLDYEPRVSAAGQLSRLLVSMLALPLAASVLASSWRRIRQLAVAWIAAVTLGCFVAWLDSVLGAGVQVALSATPEQVNIWTSFLDPQRAVGLANHPNTLALTAVLAFPVAATFIHDRKSFMRLVPVLVVISVGVMLSGGRMGLLAFGLALVGSLVFIPGFRAACFAPGLREAAPRLALVFSLGLIFAGGLLIAGSGSSAGLSSVKRLQPSQESAVEADFERRKYLSNSIELVQERPLTGSGFQLVEYSHNVYLQLLVSAGPVALAALLIVWFGFLREGIRLSRVSGSRSSPIATGLLISLGLYLLAGLASNQLTDRYIYLGIALILAGSTATGLRRMRPLIESGPDSRAASSKANGRFPPEEAGPPGS